MIGCVNGVARRRLIVAAVVAKLVTVGGIVFAITHSDWHRFAHKAFPDRLVGYSLAVAIVPVVWLVVRRRRTVAYPALVDLLTSLPFAIDIAGNLANAFDRVPHFDDACHFLNWALLFTALALTLPRTLPWLAQLGLVVGLGAFVALCWEVVEYFTFVGNGPERFTAYKDTLGDMTLGTTGALVAGVAVLTLRRRRSSVAVRTGPGPL
jgi:hypothetical protein